MSYAFSYDVPGDEHMYEQVKAHIGAERPDGLELRLVVKRAEGGLRHINVWRSADDWRRFERERVQPAVAEVLARVGVTEPQPRPLVEELDLVDVITGAQPAKSAAGGDLASAPGRSAGERTT